MAHSLLNCIPPQQPKNDLEQIISVTTACEAVKKTSVINVKKIFQVTSVH